MDNIIAKAFEEMCERYIRLLQHFYPARDATGFTERNQIHFFINELMAKLDDEEAIEWLEFPWEEKKHHIDAVVYSPKLKSVLYIEAKRFSTKAKANSIANDIKRVIKSDRSFITKNKIYNIKSEYLIVLSDVWLETDWKRSVPSWWLGDDLPIQILKWNNTNTKKLSRAEYSLSDMLLKDFNVDWANSKQYVYWLGEKAASVKNYCLLIGFKQI